MAKGCLIRGWIPLVAVGGRWLSLGLAIVVAGGSLGVASCAGGELQGFGDASPPARTGSSPDERAGVGFGGTSGDVHGAVTGAGIAPGSAGRGAAGDVEGAPSADAAPGTTEVSDEDPGLVLRRFRGHVLPERALEDAPVEPSAGFGLSSIECVQAAAVAWLRNGFSVELTFLPVRVQSFVGDGGELLYFAAARGVLHDPLAFKQFTVTAFQITDGRDRFAYGEIVGPVREGGAAGVKVVAPAAAGGFDVYGWQEFAKAFLEGANGVAGGVERNSRFLESDLCGAVTGACDAIFGLGFDLWCRWNTVVLAVEAIGCVAAVLDGRLGRREGDTSGGSAEHGAGCADGGGADVVYGFGVDRAATLCLSTAGSEFDTVLHVRSDCVDAGSEIACTDDHQGLQSQVEIDVAPGEAHFVFVDGYNAGSRGRYALDVTVGPCGDGPQVGADLFRPPWGDGELQHHAGRTFFYDGNHVGTDVRLAEGTPIVAGVERTMVVYRAAQGYGELVAVVGYVDDDAHNGDGAEHVHVGLRPQSRDEAAAVDPSAWLRDYEGATDFGRYYADSIDALERL